MKSMVNLSLIFPILLAVAACQMSSSEPVNTNATIQNTEVEILAVKNEKDGKTVQLRDISGTVYSAVISIPNLGPNSDFDFAHLQPGNRMIVSGDAWSMDGVQRTTVRAATAI